VSLSFEAVAKTATGLLLAQAFGQADEARKDQVQEILLKLFEAIRSGKSRLAETFFAQFAKRRAIDQFRRRDTQIEGKLDRAEPTEESDPIGELPSREPALEDRVLLSVAVEKLPPKLRTAFIQKHTFGMTNKEIAEQNGVDVRTVHNWLKAAGETLGLEGDDDDDC
jgi:RNA polymerase sigma factor (sigma-70 family)